MVQQDPKLNDNQQPETAFFQKEAIETLSYCMFNNRYPVINKNRGTPNLPIVKDKKQKTLKET